MSGRHVIAITNSATFAEHVIAVARGDFPDVERGLAWIEGYGWCEEITVDADDFEAWVAMP